MRVPPLIATLILTTAGVSPEKGDERKGASGSFEHAQRDARIGAYHLGRNRQPAIMRSGLVTWSLQVRAVEPATVRWRPARRPASRFSKFSTNSAPPVPIPIQFKANVGVRIGADISAGRVVHIVSFCGAVSFRGRPRAGRCNKHKGQRQGSLGRHGDVSCLSLSLTPSRCALERLN
jgi:hypothetical protein